MQQRVFTSQRLQSQAGQGHARWHEAFILQTFRVKTDEGKALIFRSLPTTTWLDQRSWKKSTIGFNGNLLSTFAVIQSDLTRRHLYSTQPHLIYLFRWRCSKGMISSATLHTFYQKISLTLCLLPSSKTPALGASSLYQETSERVPRDSTNILTVILFVGIHPSSGCSSRPKSVNPSMRNDFVLILTTTSSLCGNWIEIQLATISTRFRMFQTLHWTNSTSGRDSDWSKTKKQPWLMHSQRQS